MQNYCYVYIAAKLEKTSWKLQFKRGNEARSYKNHFNKYLYLGAMAFALLCKNLCI